MSSPARSAFEFPRTADGRRVLIVGGSTRAAAWSAIRAGWQPICADLFADVDTREIAEIVLVRDYPHSLPDDVAHVQSDCWFYTGALENHPGVIARLDNPRAPYGSLAGISDGLTVVRDPFLWTGALNRAGMPFLDVRLASNPPPRDGTWLCKPLQSAGGRCVRLWNSTCPDPSEPVYFQKRADGQHQSGLFFGNELSFEFLGMTRQLIDFEDSQAAEPFLYRGSIGPLPILNERDRETVQQLCRQVQALPVERWRGVFGVDFVRDPDGVPWIIEINPRYTASIELLELSRKQSVLTGLGSRLLSKSPGNDAPSVVAKVILYARQALIAPNLESVRSTPTPWDVPVIADIPAPESVIHTGWPICSVMASGSSETTCLQLLNERVATIWRIINGVS